MDGHVHIINRVYWEGIDAWQEQPGIGWDYARARKAGVNCVIDNIGTYGYWNYNYSPKQALRLIETAHRFAEKHSDKMAIALSVADARAIVASGRVAVFLGCESGIDHEGDIEVLGAMHRLGLRTIQFATQTGYNAFADSALAPLQGAQPTDTYKGINERGRALVREMNRLGVLIDITHGTDAVQAQLIEASRAPVVASHDTLRGVYGFGISDEILKALAAKGGLVGIHGSAHLVGPRYRKWMAEKPENAQHAGAVVGRMVGYMPSAPRPPGDRGEYIARFDEEFRAALARPGRLAGEAGGREPDPDRGRMGRAGRLRDQDGRRRPRRDRSRHGRRPLIGAAHGGGLRRDRRRAEQDHHAGERAQDHRRELAARAGAGEGGVAV